MSFRRDWRSLVEAQAGELSVEFLLSYIAVESGGAPCAVGSPTSNEKLGFAREAGLAQAYYETKDSVVFGVGLPQLRAACSGLGQTQVRELTDDEADYQVGQLVRQVTFHRNVSLRQLSAAGVTWPAWDVYALTKLQHGLPAIPSGLLPAAARDGAASSWASFKAYVLGMSPNAVNAVNRNLGPYVGEFPKVFSNAEKTVNGAGGKLAGSTAIPLDAKLVAPGLATLWKTLAKFFGW